MPLIAKEKLKGVLEIFHCSLLDPGVEWLDFLQTLAGQTSIAIDNAELFNDLQRSNWEIMRRHPRYAFEMLSPITFLHPALDIPYCHHEKWDGTGYPRRLKGEEIPFAARVFAVVDVWDALLSDRPYRPAWTKENALEHIKSLAGTHFDPKVVEIFLKMDFVASAPA